jgi:hypothetical protein
VPQSAEAIFGGEMNFLWIAFFKGDCGVCGHKRGECVEVRDAGNFPRAGFHTPFGFSHEIPGDMPIKQTFTVSIPKGLRIRYIDNVEAIS